MINLTSLQKQKISQIAKKYGVLFAVVYGSYAQNKQRNESDFDIAVFTKDRPDYNLFTKLFRGFSGVFKGKNIDLRFLNEADPFFRFEVVKEGELIYGSLPDYNQFKVYALKIYADDGRKYFPYLEKLLEKNQQKLEEKVYG